MTTNEYALTTLKKIVGDDKYQKILEQMGSCHIYIPSTIAIRNSQIVDDFNSGATATELAWKYNLNQSTIYRILDKARLEQ